MSSSELQKWQQERSISIVGEARNPVLAFQQSGMSEVKHKGPALAGCSFLWD